MFYRILGLAALLFLVACSSDTPRDMAKDARKPVNIESAQPAPVAAQPSASARVVKIGLLVPQTGQAAQMGSALLDAATLALTDKFSHLQAQGQDVKIILIPKDTKSTKEGAAQAAREVLDMGAQLILGPLFSHDVAPVAALARERGVNVITFSNNTDVAASDVFVFGFLVDDQVKRILNHALNQDKREVALLAPSNAYGVQVKKAGEALLKDSNQQFAGVLLYPAQGAVDGNLDLLVDQYKQKPFDAVLIPEGGARLISIVQGLKARGLPAVQLLGTGLWDEPSVLRSGELSGGQFVSSPPERFAEFAARFTKVFGYAPPRLSSLAYDAVALAATLAVQEQGTAPLSKEGITARSGYIGPVNGVFRCDATGICERGLAVLEATGRGVPKVVSSAPKDFR